MIVCSDNGNCTIPSGDAADRLPYCVCEEQWIGAGCHIARPRPGGGDPHLQTLDGNTESAECERMFFNIMS